MVEKPKHREAGLTPFEYATAERKGKLEKQNLAELKNKMHQIKPSDMKQVRILDKQGGESVEKAKESMKLREEAERNTLRKREHKSLMKSLTLAQKSTASMGKFDRKLSKEPEAPASQKVEKKKSNKGLFELERDRGQEKQRNMKVLDFMQRKRDQEEGGKVNANLSGQKVKTALSRAKKHKTGKRN